MSGVNTSLERLVVFYGFLLGTRVEEYGWPSDSMVHDYLL